MKKQLKEILDKEDTEQLTKYLTENKNIDYLFSVKLGDYNLSVNPLYYVLLKNLINSTKVFFTILSDLEINNLLNFNNQLKQDVFIKHLQYYKDPNSKIVNMIYSSFNKEEKNFISKMLNHYSSISDDIKEKFLTEENKLIFYIQKDNSDKLFNYLEKNPQCLKENKKNFLALCIEHQAVFCFDIVKDHLKKIKLENNKKVNLKV